MKTVLIALLAAAGLVAQGAAAQQGAGALDRIKAAKTINVAYSPDALPFSFKGANGPDGYSIDLCKRIIAQIGRATGTADLKVNWIAGSTPERLQLVATGKADFECGNSSQTLARLANVDFSGLIFLDAGGFLVRADSKVERFADMGAKKIAVLKGTTTEANLLDALKRRLVNATVVTITDPAEGMKGLDAGTIDVFVGDKIRLVGLAAQAKDPTQYALLVEELSYEPYAFALPRNDSALRLEVNRALSQVYMGGEIETIFGQWLGKLGRPTGLLAAMYLLYSIPQ